MSDGGEISPVQSNEQNIRTGSPDNNFGLSASQAYMATMAPNGVIKGADYNLSDEQREELRTKILSDLLPSESLIAAPFILNPWNNNRRRTK